uniref:RING-type domain-containing protein n=1 Tax=Clastoptera arizonana TaxID=38151 RepID=A0A1B6CRW1_9HEMI
MDKLSHSEMVNVLTKIAKTLECSVCLCTLDPPATMCPNTHLVCSSCGKDLISCPICRAKLTSNLKGPLALDMILDEIPRACNYSVHCKYMARSELQEHSQICPHRPHKCQIKFCEWKGSYENIFGHVEAKHLSSCILEGDDTKVTLKDFSIDKHYFDVKFVVSLKCFFWMHIKKDGFLNGYCAIIISDLKTERRQFMYTIEYIRKHLSYSYTQKVFKEGEYINDVDIDEMITSGKILFCNTNQISKFVNKNKELTFRFEIFEKPIERQDRLNFY